MGGSNRLDDDIANGGRRQAQLRGGAGVGKQCARMEWRRARPPLRLMRFLCRVSFRSKATISALDAHSSIEEASLERNDLWERSALSRRG